ncbi:hypothetical protein IFM89_033141, partial [Coptis chinensis]
PVVDFWSPLARPNFAFGVESTYETKLGSLTKYNAGISVKSADYDASLLMVKARLNSNGKLGALLQHELKPKSVLTISSEIDTKALDKNPRFGLALAIKP